MNEATCLICVFHHTERGECRRNRVPLASAPESWCGEFRSYAVICQTCLYMYPDPMRSDRMDQGMEEYCARQDCNGRLRLPHQEWNNFEIKMSYDGPPPQRETTRQMYQLGEPNAPTQ